MADEIMTSKGPKKVKSSKAKDPKPKLAKAVKVPAKEVEVAKAPPAKVAKPATKKKAEPAVPASRTKKVKALGNYSCRYGVVRCVIERGSVYDNFSVEIADWLISTGRAESA